MKWYSCLLCILIISACHNNPKKQNEDWHLVEDHSFLNKRNKMGYLDSIKETLIIYKNDKVQDTVYQLSTRKYKSSSEIIESRFEMENNGQLILLSSIKRLFDSSRHILQQATFRKDTLEEEKKYTYDSSGHLIQVETIAQKLDDPADRSRVKNHSTLFNGYDTIYSVYTYKNGLITEIANKNRSGKVLNEITNIYSGKEKVISYQKTGNDTIQKITFSREGKFDKQVERYHNTLVITTLSAKGRVFLILTENIKNKIKSKEVRTYDRANGLLIQMKRYISFPVNKK